METCFFFALALLFEMGMARGEIYICRGMGVGEGGWWDSGFCYSCCGMGNGMGWDGMD